VKLWRLSKFVELDGEGGRLFAGRWNRGGRAVVYTAESSALAILEVLIQYQRGHIPVPVEFIEIVTPDTLAILTYGQPTPPRDQSISRDWGEDWLHGGASAVARVPSALAPESYNLLINPAHPEAPQIKVVRHWRHSWDARLLA
jgi:RES domain-containing protein